MALYGKNARVSYVLPPIQKIRFPCLTSDFKDNAIVVVLYLFASTPLFCLAGARSPYILFEAYCGSVTAETFVGNVTSTTSQFLVGWGTCGEDNLSNLIWFSHWCFDLIILCSAISGPQYSACSEIESCPFHVLFFLPRITPAIRTTKNTQCKSQCLKRTTQSQDGHF